LPFALNSNSWFPWEMTDDKLSEFFYDLFQRDEALIQSARTKVASANKELYRANWNLQRLLKAREALSLLKEKSFLGSIKEIKELPLIQSIRKTKEGLIFRTVPLFSEVTNKRKNEDQELAGKKFVGSFDFKITNAGDIFVRNLSSTSISQVHPHSVYSSVCAGTYELAFASAAASMDLLQLVLTFLDWAQSVNAQDGRAVRAWLSLSKGQTAKHRHVTEWVELYSIAAQTTEAGVEEAPKGEAFGSRDDENYWPSDLEVDESESENANQEEDEEEEDECDDDDEEDDGL